MFHVQGKDGAGGKGGADGQDCKNSAVSEEDTPSVEADNDYGYAHFTFRYFYYPKNKTIYYSSENDIYTMNLDGTSPQKIQENTQQDTADEKYKLQHVYVYDDMVYYNDALSNDTRKVKIDGTGDTLQSSDTSGAMRMYASEGPLYFHDDTKYIKDNVLYYHKGSTDLFKKDPHDTGVETAISGGQGEGFFFAPDGIYFKLHAIFTPPGTFDNYYKVARVSYDVISKNSDHVGKCSMDILMPDDTIIPRRSVDFRDVSAVVLLILVATVLLGMC